jgi:hypothetical protein
MKNWSEVRAIIEEVLRKPKYTNSSSKHDGEWCFLSAYQIAVLVDKQAPTLKGDLPVGGKGEGAEINDSLAKQIARNLSKESAENDNLEIRFFSIDGLDAFTFNGGRIPTADEFSMFRLIK